MDIYKLLGDMSLELKEIPEDADWRGKEIVIDTENYIKTHNLDNSPFIKEMNQTFHTDLFDTFLKKWLLCYFSNILAGEKLTLKRPPALPHRILSILLHLGIVFYLSIKNGFVWRIHRRFYQVAWECIWGMKRGKWTDDFIVGGKIDSRAFLPFSRNNKEKGRVEARKEARHQPE